LHKLEFSEDYNNRIPTEILLKALKQHAYRIGCYKSSRPNGLHYASISGIDEIAASSEGGGRLISTEETAWAIHFSYGLLGIGTGERWK